MTNSTAAVRQQQRWWWCTRRDQTLHQQPPPGSISNVLQWKYKDSKYKYKYSHKKSSPRKRVYLQKAFAPLFQSFPISNNTITGKSHKQEHFNATDEKIFTPVLCTRLDCIIQCNVHCTVLSACMQQLHNVCTCALLVHLRTA